jgi:hypothetical protein
MNHLFRLNKEKREQRPLLEYLESNNANIALVPYALSALLKTYEGPNDVYHRLRIATDLKMLLLGTAGFSLSSGSTRQVEGKRLACRYMVCVRSSGNLRITFVTYFLVLL